MPNLKIGYGDTAMDVLEWLRLHADELDELDLVLTENCGADAVEVQVERKP